MSNPLTGFLPVDTRADAQLKQVRRAFQARYVPRTLTAAGSVLITDYLVGCDATAAGFTVTLPTVLDARGMSLLIVKTDSSANVVTVAAASSETINGAATETLTSQWGRAELYCDGVQWYDAAVSQPIVGAWTPTDTSGAGLTFSSASGTYEKVGRQVTARAFVIYPATASATVARIGPLPFTVANTQEARQGFFSHHDCAAFKFALPNNNTTDLYFYNIGGAGAPNSDFSAKTIYVTALYHV